MAKPLIADGSALLPRWREFKSNCSRPSKTRPVPDVSWINTITWAMSAPWASNSSMRSPKARDWLGVLVFCAASRRLRARDRWIGWSEEQRRRRLPLVVNNCRFLLLPDKTFPNLGSRSLRLTLDRLSADWQERYGHPVVLVETFIDPEQF